MTNRLEVESAIKQLPESEVRALANWLQDYLDEMWDRQIEADLASGKLDRLIAQAEEDMATNNVRDLDEVLRNTPAKFQVTSASNEQTAIIRTERGLTIAGTRITLYDVMDYVTAQYPPKFIQGLFDLTEEQINAALAYIEAHRADVEAEYQQVLKEAEELRQYYEEQNRERVARIAAKPPKPGTEAIRAKLQAEKAKLASRA